MSASRYNLQKHNKLRKLNGNVSINCFCGKTFLRKKYRKGKYCSLRCQALYRKHEANIKNANLFKLGKLKLRNVIKKTMYFLGIEHKCQICGLMNWQGKPVSMVLDHIDGKANNNFPKNLRLICHNCDSQTDHYKGRNKGNGRKSLGLI